MKTVSLELSKQLKANGYPQEGEFYWMKPYEGRIGYSGKGFVFGKLEKFGLIHLREYIASPTADEILEQLPRDVIGNSLQICRSFSDGWFVGYGDHMSGAGYKVEDGDSLADAAAKMWLYLKENNLLEVKG